MNKQAFPTSLAGDTAPDTAFTFGLNDLPRLLQAMVWPFVTCALAAVLLSSIYLRYAEPSYTIISEIVVERRQLAATQDDGGESVRFNATQAEILKSPRVIKAALENAPLPAAQRAKARESNLSEVMWVMENLTVSPVTGTQVIAIAYSTTDAQHGVRLLDAVVDQYLSLSRGSDMDIQEETMDLLENSAATLRNRLGRLEQNYKALREEDGSLGEGDEALSLYKQVAEDYNAQRIRAQREVPLLVDRLAAIRRARSTDELLSLPEKFSQGNTGRAVAQSKVEISRMLTQYTEGHPHLVAARQNQADLEARLREEANELEALVQNQLRDAEREAARLEAAYAQAVANAKAVDVQRLAQDSLRDEIDSTKVLLAEATSRINDRAIAIGSLAGGRSGTVAAVIRSPEIPAEAAWPRPRLVYALALFLAGAAALLIGLIRVSKEDRGFVAALSRSPSASELMRESARRRVQN